MNSHLRAGLIVLASVPIALSAAGAAAAVTPSVSPSPSPSVSVSASAPTNANLDSPPRTNLTAVVDPIAVPVRDGVQIQVGVRNSGPLPITAPAGQPTVRVSLVIDQCCMLIAQVKSLGGCQIGYVYPPNWPTVPAEPRRFDCSTTRTWPVGKTYWQSFVFPNLSSLANGVSVLVSGYAQDPDDRDNSRKVVVRLAEPGSGLPVTGASTTSVSGAGLALVIAGTMAIWYGRRRRRVS